MKKNEDFESISREELVKRAREEGGFGKPCFRLNSQGETINEERNERITNTIKELTKDFDSIIISGRIKNSSVTVTLNGVDLKSENFAGVDQLAKVLGNDALSRDQGLRASQTSILIKELLDDTHVIYDIAQAPILNTTLKSYEFVDKISREDKDMFYKRLTKAKSKNEVEDIIKEIEDKAKDGENNQSDSTSDLSEEEIDALNKRIMDEMAKMFKLMVEQRGLEETLTIISHSLGEASHSSVIIGAAQLGDDARVSDHDAALVFSYQEDLEDLANKNDRNIDFTKIALMGSIALTSLQQISIDFKLKEGFWKRYLNQIKDSTGVDL